MFRLLVVLALLASNGIHAQACTQYGVPDYAPDFRYRLNGDEVLDTVTGLLWQRCSVGQSGSDCSIGTATRMNWIAALTYARDYSVTTAKGWRVPNIKELRSILRYSCKYPAINVTLFPNTIDGYYWSSTSAGDLPWVVYFGSGTSKTNIIDSYLILVRDAP